MSLFAPLLRGRGAPPAAPVGPPVGMSEERVITSSNFVPPANEMFSPYDMVGHHHAMSNLTVFACVRILADTIASCPWHAYRRDADGMPKRIKPNPPLIRKPVPQMNTFDWKWFMICSLAL